jgi:lysophospholipase L1-like esterase
MEEGVITRKGDGMNHKKLLTLVIGYTSVLALVVACATPQPTPTSTPVPPPPTETSSPEPTLTPTLNPIKAATEWLYVALGDSEAVCCGLRSYPEYYAEFIEQDLNVKVNLRNRGVSGLTSDGLLRKLGTDDYRNLISQAQVVTLVITMNDLLQCSVGDRECAEKKLVAAKANYTAIIEEILTLTNKDETIIRTQTYDNPFVNRWKEQGSFEERKPMFDRWNEQIIEIAAIYDIPVARVYLDFNGPNGDQDPGDKGFVAADGMHNNDAGARRIAELLRELGYEPLAPR